MPIQITCATCNKIFFVIPTRASTAKYCSRACKDQDRHSIRGEAHPRWTGGEREKTCKYCGKKFSARPTEAISTFRTRKFCCKKCADVGGLRYYGTDHARWDGGRKKRSSKHYTWSNKIISRDKGVCQNCGNTDMELHAHHIKPFIDHDELRYDIKNGITLCAPCHWNEHSKSGGYLPLDEDIIQGETIGKKTYRRVVKPCANCEKAVSRTLANFNKSKSGRIFCDKTCVGQYRQKNDKDSW